jgi:hypothetical protein
VSQLICMHMVTIFNTVSKKSGAFYVTSHIFVKGVTFCIKFVEGIPVFSLQISISTPH